MFTRATSRSYTCLQCQYRLALRESTRIESQTITRVARRWQTSAARAAVEEEYEEDVPGLDDRRADANQRKKIYKTIRHWRPSPTAQIGVDVLGKPAEILLLSADRRRRKRAVQDADGTTAENSMEQEALKKLDSETQPRIHESLARELQPTSTKEALGNINRLGEEARESATDGFLAEEQWLKHVKALTTGFTKTQLERYLSENTDTSQSELPVNIISVRALTKPRAATEIMTKVWGLTTELSAKPDRQVSKSVNLGRGRRELILGVDREWRRFLQHVSITPSSSSGEIDITGPEEWVQKAQAVFTSLKRSVRSQTLFLPAIFSKAFEEQGSSSSLAARSILQDLIQRHEITMTKRSEWTAYAFTLDRITNFERSLVLSQTELVSHSTGSPILSSEPLNPTSVMPVYKKSPMLQGSDWFRYCLAKPASENVDEIAQHRTDLESKAHQALIGDLGRHVFDKTVSVIGSSSHGSPATVDGITTEFFASVGHVLHETSDRNRDADLTGPRNVFVETVPFLRQFLARQEVEKSSDHDTAEADDSLLRLTFTPSDSRTHPSIELQANVPAPTATGLELKIESVKLSFPPDLAHIALPSTIVDLNFTRRVLLPIFQHGTSVQEIYAPLLGQIASQLRREDRVANDPHRLHLNKLLDIDLKFLENTTETNVTKAQGKAATTSVRYALGMSDLLEKRLYRIPGQDGVRLEYSAHLPVMNKSVQTGSEVLRIVPAPQSSPIADGEQFANFAKSALGVVDILDRFVAEKTRELAHGESHSQS